MLKVLVVDDEFIVRAGLIGCIDWKQMNLELAGEASNGQEALDIILKETPDIILLDLLMPVMTGMELIQKLEDLKVKTNIIILSCHEDYNYVREAFKKGVRDYILKLSSTPEEICNVIKDVVKKILDDKSMPEKEHSDYITIDVQQSPAQIVPAGQGYFLVSFYGCSPNKKNSGLILKLSAQWLQNKDFSCINLIPCLLGDNIPAMIAFSDDPGSLPEETEQNIIHIIQGLHLYLCSFINSPLYVGISAYSQAQRVLSKAVRESQKSLDTLFYDSGRYIGVYSLLDTLYKNKDKGYSFLPKTRDLLKHQDFGMLIQQLNDFMTWAAEYKPDPRNIKLDSIDLINALNNYLKERNLSLAHMDEEYLYFYQNIANMYSIHELKNYLHNFTDNYISLLQEKGLRNMRNDIKDALKYIEQHYNDDISLPDVAEHICISKNHLSYLLKKETGKTFSDYLIEFRIEKAKELLTSENRYTVSEIAEKTGFHDTGYFSKVFKKVTGLSPVQFKKGLV